MRLEERAIESGAGMDRTRCGITTISLSFLRLYPFIRLSQVGRITRGGTNAGNDMHHLASSRSRSGASFECSGSRHKLQEGDVWNLGACLEHLQVPLGAGEGLASDEPGPKYSFMPFYLRYASLRREACYD